MGTASRFGGRKELGVKGEDFAARYLEKSGYRLVARNYRCSFGELDIIAENEEFLVFVEVKTRISSEVNPLLSITRAKQKRIYRLASYYILQEKKEAKQPRFDVISLVYANDRFKLEHLENAF